MKKNQKLDSGVALRNDRRGMDSGVALRNDLRGGDSRVPENSVGAGSNRGDEVYWTFYEP
ncbi:MAG: hypothetical protein JW944_10995 [Deltaproteobacteria bacterium]|nr:hypothetical protein [Deltaproteobacteria bacterium]